MVPKGSTRTRFEQSSLGLWAGHGDIPREMRAHSVPKSPKPGGFYLPGPKPAFTPTCRERLQLLWGFCLQSTVRGRKLPIIRLLKLPNPEMAYRECQITSEGRHHSPQRTAACCYTRGCAQNQRHFLPSWGTSGSSHRSLSPRTQNPLWVPTSSSGKDVEFPRSVDICMFKKHFCSGSASPQVAVATPRNQRQHWR